MTDASLTVGPAVHEFGWTWDAWDLLAAATVAVTLVAAIRPAIITFEKLVITGASGYA